MRLPSVIGALAILAYASSAAAAPVNVSFSPEFQTVADEEFGRREADQLRNSVSRAINSALARRGATAAEGSIEVSILDADPNRPTFEQISRTAISYAQSFSIGGADLHAVVRGPNGQTLAEVSHRRYDYGIDQYAGLPATWTGANVTIRQFAEKVADAYVANAR